MKLELAGKFSVLLLAGALLAFATPVAMAAGSGADGAGAGGGEAAGGGDNAGGGDDDSSFNCPDSGLMTDGGLFSDVCWGCAFPMRVSGYGGSARTIPGDTASATCTCPTKILLGTPTPGFTFGMWKPSHIVETVRTPGCFPSLGGTKMTMGSKLGQGGGAVVRDDMGFRSTHVYMFPTGAIFDAISGSLCSGDDGGMDMDLMAMSEIDPTYHNPKLSTVVNPEANLFNNAVAIAACMVDAVAASTVKPIRELFWCMGSWGNVYQLSGYSQARSAVQDASLTGARMIAMQHKRLMFPRTYGNAAVCFNVPSIEYPSQQYKWQFQYPYAQTSRNEWTGASTLIDREWRQRPMDGEDFVQILWRYEECCINTP